MPMKALHKILGDAYIGERWKIYAVSFYLKKLGKRKSKSKESKNNIEKKSITCK